MGFGDLKTEQGLKCLNDFLADKGYIEGYVPTQSDVCVFTALSGKPAASLVHALRWYQHIASFVAEERKSFGGSKKDVDTLGPATSDKAAANDDDDDDDDDFDMFGSDNEEEAAEAERIKAERVAEYNDKKANKKKVIAKSNIILDVKPWDDETDMAVIESKVRAIETDGLLWGASKLVPLAYGIKKLQISCVIEDDKVSTDFLEENITAHEDLIQSMDIAAFNKV